MEAYVQTFIDPFDASVAQPKILDGSVDRSCGIKLKATGTFNLDGAGGETYFVLFPGYSYCANWKNAAGAPSMHTVFPNHLETTTNRTNIKQLRLVSCGVRFSLENSADENEGFWEAVRIPLDYNNFALVDTAAPNGEDYASKVINAFAITDMSNYSTYQSGRLRDVERFMFKLNSVAPDHPFKRVLNASTQPAVTDTIDDFFDCVVIKMKGRVDAVTPSTIRYHLVSNQEVVYQENTQLSRLMIPNVMVPENDVLLNRTRFSLPAIQIL